MDPVAAERLKLVESRIAAAKEHIAGLEEDLKTETDEKSKKRLGHAIVLAKGSLEHYELEKKEIEDGAAKASAPRRAFRW